MVLCNTLCIGKTEVHVSHIHFDRHAQARRELNAMRRLVRQPQGWFARLLNAIFGA